MLFYQYQFILGFIVFFVIFISVKQKNKNLFILLASYWFYGLWNYKFLSLLIVSTIVDYFTSNIIDRPKSNQKIRKYAFSISLIINLGILGIFKYYNFFIDSLLYLAQTVGIQLDVPTLNVILPVGISFYTFQTMSYTIDVFNKKIKHEKNFLDFATYVITSRNTLLVADEHNDVVREISLKTLSEIKTTPFALVRSPGSVVEIAQGKFKNHWLIADTDNNRAILVNANSFEIVAEYANLRGTLKAIPIFLD